MTAGELIEAIGGKRCRDGSYDLPSPVENRLTSETIQSLKKMGFELTWNRDQQSFYVHAPNRDWNQEVTGDIIQDVFLGRAKRIIQKEAAAKVHYMRSYTGPTLEVTGFIGTDTIKQLIDEGFSMYLNGGSALMVYKNLQN